MNLAPAVYILNALTTALCSVLLLVRYKRVQVRLLLWSGLCFAGLALANAMVFVDLVVLTEIDLYLLRLAISVAAMGLLLYGLIWESR